MPPKGVGGCRARRHWHDPQQGLGCHHYGKKGDQCRGLHCRRPAKCIPAASRPALSASAMRLSVVADLPASCPPARAH